jgi:NADH-quinone oxidoreductase subunit A
LLGDFGYIGIFLIAALGLAATMILIPVTLRLLHIVPRKPNPTKYTTYECGMETIGESRIQFNFRYYFFALLFVIFDVQVVFLYPWAVEFNQLKLFGLVVMLVFILIMMVGFVYAWKKGVLKWN